MSSNPVPVRALGKDGPSVPALGLGMMGMSVAYGTAPSDEERFRLLDRAVELGATFWDTSDLYGDNEELLGKWFKRSGKRNEIFLSTKFGYVKGSLSGTSFVINSTGEYCKQACKESLKALGTDYIDLYYLHHANPETPIEDAMRALAELKAEGKIRHIGLSGVSSSTLRRAQKIAPVAAVQQEYSPFVLDIEGPRGTNFLATCRELGVSVVAFSPLGRGLLTTAFSNGEISNDPKDLRESYFPRFQGENRNANVKLVNQFKAFADRKGCTTSQLSLVWLLKQGSDIFPIPGTKKIKYLEENWGALDVHLTDEEETEIRGFLETAKIAGGRLPPSVEHAAFADTKELPQ